MVEMYEVDEHPIPFDQEELDEFWEGHSYTVTEPPTVDEAHDEYTLTIAEWSHWHVFRTMFPFAPMDIVYFWSRETGEGFIFNDEAGSWHNLVNLFAEIVDSEGDCREAGYDSSLMPSGSYKQRCLSCNGSWSVG